MRLLVLALVAAALAAGFWMGSSVNPAKQASGWQPAQSRPSIIVHGRPGDPMSTTLRCAPAGSSLSMPR